MSRYEEIYRNKSALGGRVYRVMSNGINARIESSDEGAAWLERKTMPLSDFESWAEDVDLRNPYDQNPAKLDRLAHS